MCVCFGYFIIFFKIKHKRFYSFRVEGQSGQLAFRDPVITGGIRRSEITFTGPSKVFPSIT